MEPKSSAHLWQGEARDERNPQSSSKSSPFDNKSSARPPEHPKPAEPAKRSIRVEDLMDAQDVANAPLPGFRIGDVGTSTASSQGTSAATNPSSFFAKRGEPKFGFKEETTKQSVLATAERIGERSSAVYPQYHSSYNQSLNAGVRAYQDVRGLEKGLQYGLSAEQATTWINKEAFGTASMNAAAKAGFFSAITKGSSYAGKLATGLEVGVGAYKTFNADTGQHLKVGVKEGGEIGSAYIGRYASARAAVGLLELGAALELAPGPGTIAGTILIVGGAVVGGLAGVSVYKAMEPKVETYIDEHPQYFNRFTW